MAGMAGVVLSVLLAAGAATPAPAPAAKVDAGSWTGFVTDTHCGKMGASRDHTAACVQKCMKGGSRPQIFNEADGKIYDLDAFDKVKELVGVRLTVKGTLDAKTNTIAVAFAEQAPK